MTGVQTCALPIWLTLWDRFAVVLRTATMQIGRLDYVLAARATGASHGRIMLRELLPNILGHFLVVFSYEAGQAVLAAAALSFLGLGIPPPEPSWGLMMAEGRNWLLTNPWLIAIAGFAVMGIAHSVAAVSSTTSRVSPSRQLASARCARSASSVET